MTNVDGPWHTEDMSNRTATTITFHDISDFDSEIVKAKAEEISEWANAIVAQGHDANFAIDWITANTGELFTRGAVKRLVSIGDRG